MKKVITAVLGTLLLSAVFVPGATGATPTGPPLTPDQQAQLDYNTLGVGKLVTSPTVYDAGYNSRSLSGCATKAHEYDQPNKFGNTLVKVGFSLKICWKNGDVISKNWGAPWCWAAQFPNMWNCQNGDTYIEDQSGQALPRKYIWRQYRFHWHMCVTWICKDAWPWVYIGGRGDGTFGVNGGQG